MDAPRCWCGQTALEAFSAEYSRCPACETLVDITAPAQADPHVQNDDADFYGKDYWLKFQAETHGYDNITVRSRDDLAGRAVYWLRALLQYKLPPGKVLELGSAHGGFVAMLNWAGFDATGLELSPWVVDYARKTFNVPMLLGPLEDQQIPPSSLDALAMMDVLEHLPDPVATMKHAVALLKPDGVIAAQTPCYPEGMTQAQMLAEGRTFKLQLKPGEHRYLFSQKAVVELFHRIGLAHVVFEPAIFAHYDMFAFASPSPLTRQTPEAIAAALIAAPAGRAALATIDLLDRVEAANRLAVEKQDTISKQAEHIRVLSIDYDKRGKALQDVNQQMFGWGEKIRYLTSELQLREGALADLRRRWNRVQRALSRRGKRMISRYTRYVEPVDGYQRLWQLLQDTRARLQRATNELEELSRRLPPPGAVVHDGVDEPTENART